jgi:hypothetical protein
MVQVVLMYQNYLVEQVYAKANPRLVHDSLPRYEDFFVSWG